MRTRQLDPEELALLRIMVAADEAASREGLRDETFAVIMVNGGPTYLDHRGLGGERPQVSKRAVLGLRDAGLFRVVSETKALLRFYLSTEGRTWLSQDDAPTDEPRLDPPDDANQVRLLQVIFERFHVSGEWPRVDRLRHELDQADDSLDVVRVGRDLDPGLGTVGIGHEARATLTIHGVAGCSGADEELEDVLRTVLLAYQRFRADGPGARITGEDLERELALDELRVLRTFELIQWLPGIDGGSGAPPDSWYRQITPDITALRKVTTVEELLAIAPRPGRMHASVAPSISTKAFLAGDTKRTAREVLAGLHPLVVTAAGALFHDGHYAQAAFQSFKAIEVRLRDLSGLDLSGRDLAAQALGGNRPPVMVSRHPGRTGADEQEGLRFLFMGVMQGLRNPGGHELDALDRSEALEQLATASLLMRWLDTSRNGEESLSEPEQSVRRRGAPAAHVIDRHAWQAAKPSPRLIVLRELLDMSHRQARTSVILELELASLAERSGASPDALQNALVDLLAEGLVEPYAATMETSAEAGACRITGDGVREATRLLSGG